MISAQTLKRSLVDLGYRPTDVLLDYHFASVDEPGYTVQRVDVAAFLDTPASYRTAAVAVVMADDELAAVDIARRRSLGAPYLIALTSSTASAWTYTAQGPTKLGETARKSWQELLRDDADQLRPRAIRELKTTRLRSAANAQPSLFDPATLLAVQAKTQTAVHELLQTFLAHFEGEPDRHRLSLERDFKALFPLVFRMLAGKILIDRDDARVRSLPTVDAHSVLARIERLYSLEDLGLRWNAARAQQLETAWQEFRAGLYLRNVAAEDLAFVYENTLISPAVRKRLGTHSTPSCVAEYVIRSFALPTGSASEDLSVYEPFAGSCVFLTSALGRFKELLPAQWTPRKTHEHLVKRFQASELDPFAAELARLSLILADYPNHNGWLIRQEDVFAAGVIKQRCSSARITVCNPPFEDFEEELPGLSVHKPVAALETILDEQPSFLGIVMPDGFATHKKYRMLLDRVVRTYLDVEVLKLPEGVFRKASVGAEVLIAQQPRAVGGVAVPTHLRRSVVKRVDWPKFQETLRPSTSESNMVRPDAAAAFLVLQPLQDVWKALEELPRLGQVAEIHRGLEWSGDQSECSRDRPAIGFKPGLHRIAGSLDQFRIVSTTFLDCRPSKIRRGALKYPWDKPKLICNAVRTSRGPWRLAAAVDASGLIASQQFFGVWLTAQSSLSLAELACILNSPVVNAYSFCHDAEKGMRAETMRNVPLPTGRLPTSIIGLVREYLGLISEPDAGPLFSQNQRSAVDVLLELDAVVLAAYDLPPRLERALLRLVSSEERPIPIPWPGYPGLGVAEAAVALKQRLAAQQTFDDRTWLEDFSPLPPEAADVFELA